ncbi:MAG: prenyltransferase [Thermoplasmata archaeon]
MNLRTWARASRAPFFVAVLMPSFLGAALAYRAGSLQPLRLLFVLAGMVLANAGTNFLNDYFDFRSGADVRNRNRTPFSGGSPYLPSGALEPRSVLRAGLLCLGAALAVAVYLALEAGVLVLALAGAGGFIAFFYTAPPIRLGYRGLGELSTGVALGPLTVLGVYYVMTGSLTWEPLVASAPVGILVATILFVNEVPDLEADRSAGKRHIVVLLGREGVVRALPALFVLVYLSILAGWLSGALPVWALAGALSSPLALKVVRVARKNYKNTAGYVPAMSGTIAVYMLTGLLLIAGVLVPGG